MIWFKKLKNESEITKERKRGYFWDDTFLFSKKNLKLLFFEGFFSLIGIGSINKQPNNESLHSESELPNLCFLNREKTTTT